jgi:hypothetical protein
MNSIIGVDYHPSFQQIAFLIEETGFSAILGLIKQTILSMQNRFLQGPLNDVVVQRSRGLTEKKGQPIPMFQAVSDRGSQTGVRLDFILRQLSAQPGVQPFHHRSITIG